MKSTRITFMRKSTTNEYNHSRVGKFTLFLSLSLVHIWIVFDCVARCMSTKFHCIFRVVYTQIKGHQHLLNLVESFSENTEGSLVWSWIKNGACAWLTMQWSVHRGYRHYLKMNETHRTISSLGICCQSHSLTPSRSISFSFARFDSWQRFRAVEI